ncbi:MAG: prephenate dehydrogenase [Megasphaera sp.]|jgi:prephenate dehydrogenase|nr:prephenate dehydrogenase [Megasphaera sp.]
MESTDSGFFTDKTIAIVGLGLIGGSYAKGLRNMGVRHIIAVDVDKVSLDQAQEEGVIDEGYTSGGTFLGQADIIIFCMAAKTMISFIEENVSYLKVTALLTDVAGIKGQTAQTITGLLPAGIDFVPGHPMAGREGCGYGMSRADIFYGANYIIVPHQHNTADHIAIVKALALALGCSHVVCVTPEEHDELIAYTSSLPHVLATALVNSQSMNPMIKYFVAGSFRDGTRVADINASLWTQLFLSNRKNLLCEIDHFSRSLKRFSDMLQREDTTAMIEFLQQAAMRRRELVHEKHTH